MRLIDADDLLQSLAVAFDTFDPRFLRDRSIRGGLKLARTAIGEAKTITTEPALREPWISVKDRLPDLIPCNAGTAYSEAVIVWTSGRKAMIAVYDGIDFMCAADYWEAWGETITHWMTLPKPPEEGT